MIVKVEITEILKTVRNISAESEEEALEIVQELYNKEEIILGAEHYADTIIQVKEEQK